MRIPFTAKKPQPKTEFVWPPHIDRLFDAVSAVVESVESAHISAWEFDISADGEELFTGLKSAYEDICLLDTVDKVNAAVRRFLAAWREEE